MAQVTLNDVDVLIGDPDQNSLSILRAVLGNSGFRNMQVGRTLEEVRDSVSNELPDLLICDCDLPGGDFFDFVYSLRHHEFGRNPFLSIIAVTRTPSPENVRRISECGVDHLVIKPFSTGQMMDRIKQLVGARKLFVVTSDYIGPDRRIDVERGSTVTRMNVPNTLKAKIAGRATAEDIQRAIDLTVAEVNVQKMERYDDEITFLVEQIVPDMEKGSFDDTVVQFLGRLVYVAGDISRRMVGTKYAHVAELCQALHTVTNTVFTARGDANARDIQLLRPLSQAIKVGFGTSEEMIAAAREISKEALSRFREVHAETPPEISATPMEAPPVYGIVTEFEATGESAKAPSVSVAAPIPAPAPTTARAAPPLPVQQEGTALGLEASAPRSAGNESGDFNEVFVDSLCEFVRQRLEPWQVGDLETGPLPFLLAPGFCEKMVEAVRKYVARAIPGNRRMVVLSQSVSRSEITEDYFMKMFAAPQKENVPRFLWNNWWDDIKGALSEGDTPFGVNKEVAKDAPGIWDIIQKGAAQANYDAPKVEDIPLIQLLFDFDHDEVRGVMKGVLQVLEHEASEFADDGASRNYMLSQIDALPQHCGEWIALWAFYTQSKIFTRLIQKSYVASTGRTAKERRAALPYYLRWAPDLTRVPSEDLEE